MAYNFGDHVSNDDWREARLIELNVAKACYRHLKRGSRAYFLVTSSCLKRRVENPEDSARVWEGVDYIQMLWGHFGAANWIRPEDCSNWDQTLWLRAMTRLYNKFTMGTFDMFLDKETFEDGLGDTE
jgi:hypothetical protein